MLVDKLRANDPVLKWRGPPVPAAPDFIRRLVADGLYALVDFRNDLPPPWDAAVLIEVGEFRRPGRKVSAKEAAEAVDAFVKLT